MRAATEHRNVDPAKGKNDFTLQSALI